MNKAPSCSAAELDENECLANTLPPVPKQQAGEGARLREDDTKWFTKRGRTCCFLYPGKYIVR